MGSRTRKLAGRAAWGAIAASVLLYGMAQAGIRSPWFRVAVERRLSRAAGMEVRVGRIRATESLNLRIGGISALEDSAGMEVRVLRVKWSCFAPHIRKLVAEDVVLTMAPDGEGRLLPAFAGERAWELVGRLARGMVPQTPPPADSPAAGDGDGVRKHVPAIGVPHVRLIRGMCSLRDASGRERAYAQDVEIDRTLATVDGRTVERWEVQAAVLSVEGMQLTGVEWSAECTEDGWDVKGFASDGWSGWTPADAPEEVERATEKYRTLLDSI